MVNAVGLPLQPVLYTPVDPIAPVQSAAPDPQLIHGRPTQPPVAGQPNQAVALAAAQAAATQDGLGPLLADLGRASEAPDAPPALRQAAADVLKLQTPLGPGLTAAALRQAAAQSGLFLEARLATAPTAPPGPDLKAALLILRQVLAQATGSAPPTAPTHAPAPPPYRGAPTRGQRPAESSLQPGATLRASAGRLLQETTAAVAREELLQVASLPDPAAPSQARWMFEVPFVTPQGPAVAQFEVSRDPPEGDGAEAGVAAPVWRARFSLDLEPLGPVHAALALSGERVAVSLWGERPETAARLRTQAADLVESLAPLAGHAEVSVFPGAPPAAAPAPGRLVDQAS
jgi:hypothetical protein